MHKEAVIFDFLKSSMGFESDAQLMTWLGISKDSLSGMRTGRLPMGDNIRFLILNKWWTQLRPKLDEEASMGAQPIHAPHSSMQTDSGFNAQSLLETITARRLAKEKEAGCSVPSNETAPNSVDGALLDAYKALKCCATDAELASLLGIKRQSISMVRSGRNGLGPIPLLRIFEDLFDGPALGLQPAVHSSEALLNLITLGRTKG